MASFIILKNLHSRSWLFLLNYTLKVSALLAAWHYLRQKGLWLDGAGINHGAGRGGWALARGLPVTGRGAEPRLLIFGARRPWVTRWPDWPMRKGRQINDLQPRNSPGHVYKTRREQGAEVWENMQQNITGDTANKQRHGSLFTVHSY